MTKETYSQKMSEIMYRKIKAIEYLDLRTLMEKDDDFELAICIAYLSLSKEKIIEKDIKNKDRLGRLTEKVDTAEIDKVFQPGFAKEMPVIKNPKENNNVWILDNIRDSIMHGAFDIDEENKCFVISNTKHDRDMDAEIPFSWFIAYAKNDILSKKLGNTYTIQGFYNNKKKKGKRNLNTKKELVNNILYRVNIYGKKFNTKDIEIRINELFDLYSKEEISTSDIEKYQQEINKSKIKYNEEYITSFFVARQKVIDTIQKEFPGVNVKITINNNKSKLSKKLIKRLPQYFTDYDLMISMFNDRVSSKSMSLLRTMSHIIENIDSNNEIDYEYDWKKSAIALHKMLTNEDISNKENYHISLITNQDLEVLRSIYLSVYGLSTLVINHKTLYNQHFLNRHPSEFGLYACLKQPYIDYAKKRKSLYMQTLDIQIAIDNKKSQLSDCENKDIENKEVVIQRIQNSLNNSIASLKSVKEELSNLDRTTGFDPVIKYNEIDYKQKNQIESAIETYITNFNNTTDVESRKILRKIISKLLDVKIEEESKYTYGYCSNMEEVLTIMRNSFSHIGRIYIGKNNGTATNIVLNDYDENSNKTGEVMCKYGDLVFLLSDPYYETKTNTK